MEAASFLTALGRRTRLACNARDPLAQARRILDEKGETAEGQALRRVIKTLANAKGEFNESEIWLFSADACALVNARLEGRYSSDEWQRRDQS